MVSRRASKSVRQACSSASVSWPLVTAEAAAAMQITPGAMSNSLMPSAMTGQMAQRLSELRLEILGRDNLITLIQMPKLDLYKKERARYSVEDVAEDTFRKDIQIQEYETNTTRS